MKGKEAVAVTGIGGYKIGSRRLMDNRRGGPTFSRFVPARGMGVARNGDEQVADDLKKLSIADKTEKEEVEYGGLGQVDIQSGNTLRFAPTRLRHGFG